MKQVIKAMDSIESTTTEEQFIDKESQLSIVIELENMVTNNKKLNTEVQFNSKQLNLGSNYHMFLTANIKAPNTPWFEL